MKRDMDLIREILLQVEARPTAQSIDLVELPGRNQEEISYHVKLLADAGYIDAYDLRTLGPGGFKYAPSSLTNEGHDFLDAARNNTVWKRAKEKLSEIGGSAPLDVVRGILTTTLKEILVL